MMSDLSYEGTPEWMKHVVVFMPDDVMIAGKYTGYYAVETGETIWSKFVDRERHERLDRCEGISMLNFSSEAFFDKKAADADHGYLCMYMWMEHHVYSPCYYHKVCWEAVGSPVGYRAPSITSQNQGFGSAARLHGVENYGDYDEDRADGPIVELPSDMIGLWAVNSICHFIYTMGSWARAMENAENKRDLFRSMDEILKMVEETDAPSEMLKV